VAELLRALLAGQSALPLECAGCVLIFAGTKVVQCLVAFVPSLYMHECSYCRGMLGPDVLHARPDLLPWFDWHARSILVQCSNKLFVQCVNKLKCKQHLISKFGMMS
jgi:hypothetical protein